MKDIVYDRCMYLHPGVGRLKWSDTHVVDACRSGAYKDYPVFQFFPWDSVRDGVRNGIMRKGLLTAVIVNCHPSIFVNRDRKVSEPQPRNTEISKGKGEWRVSKVKSKGLK